MVLFLYEIVLWIGFLLFLPKIAYSFFRYGKYKESFLKRFGKGFPYIERKGPVIWIHAVSVGECQAVSSLFKRLKKELPDATFVISTVTETGQQEAKKTLAGADYFVYLPFDFRFCVGRIFAQCRPDLVILTEGDYWFQFLSFAKKLGSKIVVVNGKLSASSAKRLQRLSFFAKRLFFLIDTFCVQSELYKERLLFLGVSPRKCTVTGNLKCDIQPEPLSQEEKAALRKKLALTPNDTVVVLASTHDPEEELLLKQLIPLFQRYASLKVVVVPRHPERFLAVEALLQRLGVAYGTWSKGAIQHGPRVMLVDAMGVLRKVYQIADIAVVAGSFTPKIGGHNIFEAEMYGVAVIVGPFMHTQRALLECSLAADAVVQTEDVGQAIEGLLESPERRSELGRHALEMCKELQGATERTLDSLSREIDCIKKTKGA